MPWTWKVSEELIEKAAWSVTSADKAYAWLREQGYDVRRADVRGAWKDYNEKTYYEGPISQWDPNRKIPKAWIVQRETVEASGYMHMFKIKGIDPVTGEEKTQVWSIVTEEVKPFSELEPEMARDVEQYSDLALIVPVSILPAGIVHLVPKE